MKCVAVILACVLLLTACAWGQVKPTLPYDAWYLGFSAPPYMEVWVETADVEDIRGGMFPRANAGTVSLAYSGEPDGWGRTPGSLGRLVRGADLPARIHVRWQSLVEPQTYSATLEIPERARALMLQKAESRLAPGRFDYQEALSLGFAPGGVVKAWVRSPAGAPVEVLCQQAEVEPKGPDLGEYGGRYVTLPAKAKAYIEKHPIPYDSWKCPADR